MSRILVIDDSPSALAFTELILAEAGHQVVSRPSGSGAMNLAARMHVDLIITDVYMPDQDGLEVIREARKQCPRIPIIAMSGSSDATVILNTARLLGAASMLRKPFSKQQLLDAVGTVLVALTAAGVALLEKWSA